VETTTTTTTSAPAVFALNSLQNGKRRWEKSIEELRDTCHSLRVSGSSSSSSSSGGGDSRWKFVTLVSSLRLPLLVKSTAG